MKQQKDMLKGMVNFSEEERLALFNVGELETRLEMGWSNVEELETRLEMGWSICIGIGGTGGGTGGDYGGDYGGGGGGHVYENDGY